MALKRHPDGHFIIECTAEDIDPESILHYEDMLGDDYCPICGEQYDVLGRCIWRNEWDHKVEKED
jgi:hypothetical protein